MGQTTQPITYTLITRLYGLAEIERILTERKGILERTEQGYRIADVLPGADYETYADALYFDPQQGFVVSFTGIGCHDPVVWNHAVKTIAKYCPGAENDISLIMETPKPDTVEASVKESFELGKHLFISDTEGNA